MKYENIKSWILIILVLCSILLTWNLWTYQPNYETMEKSNNIAEVNLSEKQEVPKIIKPDIVFFHVNGAHYGLTKADKLNKLIKEIGGWVFYDVKNYTANVKNVNDFIHQKGNVEIVFPGEIPNELYRNVLNFEQKRLPPFNFDRIIINVENSQREKGIVYFVSTNSGQVYMSHISLQFLNNFNHDFFKKAYEYPRYFAYNPTGKRTLFLPINETEMMEYKYLPVTLNSEKFKEALFSDPNFVQRSEIDQEEEYTDASSKMTVNYLTNMLIYVNPTADTDYPVNTNDLVKQSIDFVNEHGGWTDPFRYVNKDSVNHKVTFRLYSIDGYPVFNENGMSEISEVWGRNDLNKYVRPNISLELPLKSETQNVSCPSGEDVLNFLKHKENFKPELLEAVSLGYQMVRDTTEPRLIVLKPAWFFLYNHTWSMINMNDLGGLKHGLE